MPLLPVLPEHLGASIDAVSWVGTISLVSGAMVTAMIGRLGERFGMRRALLTCVIAGLAGSLLGALSRSLLHLLVARALQGGAVGATSLTLGILRGAFPGDRARNAMTVLSVGTVMISIGTVPLVTAVLLDVSVWQAAFWAGVVTSVASGALVIRCVDADVPTRAGSFDLVGASGICVVLTVVLLPVSRGTTWGWASPTTIALFAASAPLAAAWWSWERRHPSPVIDPEVFRHRPVALIHAASFVIGFAVWAQLLLTYAIVQLPASTGHGLGRSFLVAALVQAPGIAALAVGAPVATHAMARYRPRPVLAGGCIVVCAGFVFTTVFHATAVEIGVGSAIVLCGLGVGYGTVPALLGEHHPAHETARSNALTAISRVVGSAVAGAVAGTVLATFTTTADGREYPSDTAFRSLYGLCALVAAIGVVAAIAVGAGRRPVFQNA